MTFKTITKIVPIILAGGNGSRLWPLSRKSFPKQFLNLLNEDEYTMLQKTYKRIEPLEDISRPIVICNEEHRFIVGHQMREINIEPLEILLEPEGRNTAPAITIAALKVLDKYKDSNIEPILLILSSDHLIKNITNFHYSIKKSINKALKDNLIIFGVPPTYPATGYGYIKSEDVLEVNNYTISKVEKFIEKPNYNTAKVLIKDKKYSWNSGMFVFKASTIVKELKSFAPSIVHNCRKCLDNSKQDLDFLRLDSDSFLKCDDISIDVSIFEKTSKAFVIPLNCSWDDLGSWESLWKVAEKDLDGNSTFGKVLIKNTKNSLIKSESKLVVSIGLENLLIVETRDSVLVAKKDCSQSLKEMVSLMKEKGFNEGQNHLKIYRPWGSFLTIEKGDTWQIKKIKVNPGESLSLQMHFHRSEHWVIVEGTAKIQIDDTEKIIGSNESVYIPLGVKHRLSNPTKLPLTLIEIQSGSYLGEDDIVRFKDIYNK